MSRKTEPTLPALTFPHHHVHFLLEVTEILKPNCFCAVGFIAATNLADKPAVIQLSEQSNVEPYTAGRVRPCVVFAFHRFLPIG